MEEDIQRIVMAQLTRLTLVDSNHMLILYTIMCGEQGNMLHENTEEQMQPMTSPMIPLIQ